MKPRVAVLCGGVSAEHQVSLVSASEVCQALRVARYPFLVCWIDPDGGDWHWLPPLWCIKGAKMHHSGRS